MLSNGAIDPAVRAVIVDGQSLKTVHRPLSARDVADVLRDADQLRKPVIPTGGGSALALGNISDSMDEAIDLTALNRVMHFEPADLTLSVEAGARFADVQRTLGERGQTIPLDVPDPEVATIGGLIATALSGPRRLGSGSLRDLLIGISVAYPSGVVAKAGGLVVKNVTGFDLMRLHHGALGTLGVIVSANFKTTPLHRAEATLLAEFETLHQAIAMADVLRASRIQPIALEIVRDGDLFRIAVRIAGRPSTVDLLLAEAELVIGRAAKRLPGGESSTWWAAYVQSQSLMRDGRVLIRSGSAPRETGRLAQDALDVLQAHGVAVDQFNVSPGLGSVMTGFDARDLAPERLASIQAALLKPAAHATVLNAPAELKRGVDVWGRQPETLSVMQALKAEFDPNRILNPGRFAGRI